MIGLIGIFGDKFASKQNFEMMISSLTPNPNSVLDVYCSGGPLLARCHLGKYPPEQNFTSTPDGKVLVLVHGRIFRDEIVNIEVKKDAQHCLERYLAMGMDFVRGLNGNFFLVIHDGRVGKAFVATDRFGFRPHYYYYEKGSLILAPEPKGILSIIEEGRVSEHGVVEFLAKGEFWGGRTMFQDISLIPMASIMTFEDGALTIDQYWDMKYEPDEGRSEDHFVDDLIRTMRDAVEVRLKDGLRPGLTLSGGLDSRTILASMEGVRRSKLTVLTFGPSDCDEANIAKRVTKKARVLKHDVEEPTAKQIIDNAEKDVALTEGRIFLGMAFVHPMFEKLGKDVDQIMDGFAMDLTLGGSYLRQQYFAFTDRQELFGVIKGKRLFSDDELSHLLRPDIWRGKATWLDATIEAEMARLCSGSMVDQLDEFVMKTHVAWMHIGDVALLEHVEISHPSSDNRFYDIILSIPTRMRLNHHLYKKFLTKLSPELANIPYNQTMVRVGASELAWEFGRYSIDLQESIKRRLDMISKGSLYLAPRPSYVNYDHWFRVDIEWKRYIETLLLDESDGSGKLFNFDYIRKLLEDEKKGMKNMTKLLHIATVKLFIRHHKLS